MDSQKDIEWVLLLLVFVVAAMSLLLLVVRFATNG